MPGEIHLQSEITARGADALRELARLLARQAAAEVVLMTKDVKPAQSSSDQLDEDRSYGTTTRKPAEH